jgi:hypothetical protein
VHNGPSLCGGQVLKVPPLPSEKFSCDGIDVARRRDGLTGDSDRRHGADPEITPEYKIRLHLVT